MERMKLAAVVLALFAAVGMAGCQRADEGQTQGDTMQRDESAPSDTTGAPSGGPMGGSSGESGAGAPPSGTQ